MRKDYTKDTDFDQDMEEIRQVPLEAGQRSAPLKERTGSTGHGRSRAKGGRRPPDASQRQARPQAGEEKRTVRRPSVPQPEKGKSSAPNKDGDANGPRRSGPKGGRRRGVPVLAFLLALVFGVLAGLGGGYYLWGWERPYTVDLKAVEVPEWVKQEFIRKNIFSRPDVSRKRVNNIVIHYVANPGSTAEENRNYFDSLADQDAQKSGTSTSSHFVVGLEGEVIQCIPITEIAYANAPRNDDTIAIEVCHPDDTGKFNDATYESVVNLTAWLCKELKLSAKDVVRHYDINGKMCPKYFVDHEDAWDQLKKDVDKAMKEL